ncbi:MAG: hypothetical protein CMH57_10360 [Myxococcales bacterium]|nr:hypothetical protein [Myxococcales bacterium]
MNTTQVTDDLIWFPDLELTLDFRGTWSYEMLYPPAYPILGAWCEDAPIALEVYPMDPDHFPTAEAVARDLIYCRLQRVSIEDILGEVDAVDLTAVGIEREVRAQITGRVVFDNDTYYVLAFSGNPNTIERERWRVEAMLSSATFGKNKAYGRGVRGLLNLVGSQLAESDVPVGQSRSQVSPWLRTHVHRKRGDRSAPSTPKPPPPPSGPRTSPQRPRLPKRGGGWLEDEFAALERGERPEPVQDNTASDTIEISEEEFERFEASLKDRPPPPPEEPPARPPWPAPWEPLPNVAHERAEPTTLKPPPRFAARSRSRREWELISFTEQIPARVAFYGEKIYGVGESVEYHSEQPFSVAGLERIPLLLEASLRHLQGELPTDELLTVGEPRRAISRLGREIPNGHAIALGAAVTAMIQEDDATAFDLIGWRLGWRSIQQHLPSFGLTRHSLISPMRAQALALTDCDGPLQGLDLSDRLELWRELDEDGRRQIIGQVHNANLDTSLDDLTQTYLDAIQDPTQDWTTTSRWSLALGPRGTAGEYGQLMARLSRGEVLSPAHSGWVLERLKPCAGDHLSGLTPGVSMFAGKLGQLPGSLNATGILGQIDGGEVAVCMLLRDIQTRDHTALVEQTRTLASYIYQYVLDI